MTAAIIHGPTAQHGMHFADRAQLRDNNDVYYHGKPQLNHRGIAYRQPKKVIRLHTAADVPPQPLSDSDIQTLVLRHLLKTGRQPTTVFYPGTGAEEFKGLTLDGHGYIGLRLIPSATGEAYCG